MRCYWSGCRREARHKETRFTRHWGVGYEAAPTAVETRTVHVQLLRPLRQIDALALAAGVRLDDESHLRPPFCPDILSELCLSDAQNPGQQLEGGGTGTVAPVSRSAFSRAHLRCIGRQPERQREERVLLREDFQHHSEIYRQPVFPSDLDHPLRCKMSAECAWLATVREHAGRAYGGKSTPLPPAPELRGSAYSDWNGHEKQSRGSTRTWEVVDLLIRLQLR